jgi:ADP-ribose pyrophosphatase
MPGGRIATREIVEHPGAAAVVAVTDDDMVILVRQYRKALERFLLEIPAGTLEPGETPAACAQRELAEEAGYSADTMDLMLTFAPSPGLLTEEITIFRAGGLRPVARHIQPEEEGLGVVVVPRSDIPDLLASGQVRDAKTLIGLMMLAWRPADWSPHAPR